MVLLSDVWHREKKYFSRLTDHHARFHQFHFNNNLLSAQTRYLNTISSVYNINVHDITRVDTRTH
jgi:hypothetical protein